MGKLTKFNLEEFDCDAYVETGIGRCDSFRHARRGFPASRCFGVDLDNEFVDHARREFPDSEFYNGTSIAGLTYWFNNGRLQKQDRILFFLDAHFPGADYRGAPYDPDAPDALPLREELLLIRQYRRDCQDIIVCDDARLYFPGPFQNGPHLMVDHGIDNIFPERDLSIDRRDEGYIVIRPSKIT